MNIVLMQNEEKTNSLELLELINFARMESNETLVRRNDFHARIEDELEGEYYESFVVKNPNGTDTTAFKLTPDQCMVISMRESKKVRRYVTQKIKELSGATNKPLNLNDPATLRGLLIGYTEQVEQLTIERDTAIATKAQISDRKTATALNTASQAVKRANKLESEIGRCINHATILAVRSATGTEHAWQPLRKYCKAFDIDTNTVHDERYGKVKSYPARAWMAVHGVDINGLFGE